MLPFPIIDYQDGMFLFPLDALDSSQQQILYITPGVIIDEKKNQVIVPGSSRLVNRTSPAYSHLQPTAEAAKVLKELSTNTKYLLDYSPKEDRFRISAGEEMRVFLDPIGGFRYNPRSYTWSCPNTMWTAKRIYSIFGGKERIVPTKRAREVLDKYTRKIQYLNPLFKKIERIKMIPVEELDITHKFDGKYEPYEHQKKLFWTAYKVLQLEDIGWFFFAGVGVGKTLPAVNVAIALHEQGLVNRVLVITPAALKFNFGEQIEIHSKYRGNVLVDYGYDKRKGRSGRRYRYTRSDVPIKKYYERFHEYIEEPDSLFTVVNYEAVVADPKRFISGNYDLLIIDEAHYLKNRNAQRTKAVKEVAWAIPRRLGITGTVVAKDVLDIWSQFDVIDPDVFPVSYWDFEQRVAIKKDIKKGTKTIPIVVGFKDEGVEWVNQQIFTRGIQYKTAECIELPETIYQEVSIETPHAVLKKFHELRDELVVEIGTMGDAGYQYIEASNQLAAVSRLRQLSSGFIGVPKEDDPTKVEYIWLDDFKIKSVMDIIDNLDGHNIIIWFWHKTVRDRIALFLGKRFPKDRYAIIDGEVDSKAKARIVSEFQDGKYRFLLAQLQVSEGYTVTAADVCIYVENSYALKDRIQSEGRILRAGQKSNKCIIYDVLSMGTLDHKILRTLKARESLSERVLAEWFVTEWAGK